jgi:ABC-type sugar transport system ATPase subunit
MLSANNISKRFGASQALRSVSVDFHRGEVVSLVGENGAGKSTLLKLLAAVFPWDDGQASIDGQPYVPTSLIDAERKGVALVFQELNVNKSLTIAENIMLGRLRRYRKLGLVDWKRLRSEAQLILDRIDAGISVTSDMNSLDLGQLKTIEVARALAADPQYIFFDESTAFLNNQETRRLLKVISSLRAQDLGIAFVSHHLNEVFEISDRLAVLKDGAFIGSYPVADITESRLHELMVGRDLAGGLFPQGRQETGAGAPAFVAQNLSVASGAGPFDFEVPEGSILGIGGLKGSGGDALLQLIMGTDTASSGGMSLHGADYSPSNPRAAWENGIAYVPGDRTGEGLIPEFTISENLTLAARPRYGVGLNDGRASAAMAADMVDKLAIKIPSLDAPVSSLSGGNMQKVVLGKCLATSPRLLLLNNPTRGVDVGAKAEIYRLVRQLADRGMSILMVTEDLPELIGMADQIMVTRRGTISKTFAPGIRPSEEEVVKWMM